MTTVLMINQSDRTVLLGGGEVSGIRLQPGKNIEIGADLLTDWGKSSEYWHKERNLLDSRRFYSPGDGPLRYVLAYLALLVDLVVFRHRYEAQLCWKLFGTGKSDHGYHAGDWG